MRKVTTTSTCTTSACSAFTLASRAELRLAKAIVTARVGDFVAEASVTVRTREGERGMFKDWRYKALPSPDQQAYVDPDSGYVEINSRHPVNRKYFGETELDAIDRVERLP